METKKQNRIWQYLCLLLLIVIAWLTWKYCMLRKHSIEFNPSSELIDSLAIHHLDGTSEDKAQIEKLMKMDIQALSDMYEEAMAPTTTPISASLATRLHTYYVSTEHPADSTSIVATDVTRAVFMTLKEIFSAMATMRDWPGTTEIRSPALHNSAFYAYLIRHDKDSSDAQGVQILFDEQTSVAIQLAVVNVSANPTVIPDKILDLGDLCPPRCPSNEQIRSE